MVFLLLTLLIIRATCRYTYKATQPEEFQLSQEEIHGIVILFLFVSYILLFLQFQESVRIQRILEEF